MTDLAVRELTGFQTLDTYAPQGIKKTEHRPDAIATISAGYKDKSSNLPKISRDGTIHLHDAEGRASELAKLLKENPKVLTITPAFDDPQKFMQQRFTRYSASRLEVHGDLNQLTEIKDTGKKDAKGNPIYEHVSYLVGTREYQELLQTTKVTCSFYFFLCEWNKDTPRILLPDGFGFYRLRFTSRNSLANIMASLQTVHKYSNGHLAGIPFELRLVNREVADPTGARRTVPVWTITMKKQGLAMDSAHFRMALEGGIKEAATLQLEPPKPETLEMLMAEPDTDLDSTELDPDDARMLESGIDYKQRLKQWFQMIKGTMLEPEEAQIAHLEAYTPYSSREQAAKYLTEPEWGELLESAGIAITNAHKAEVDARNEAELTDPDKYRDDITREHLATLNNIVVQSGINKTNAIPFIGWLCGIKITSKTDITPGIVEKAANRFADFKKDEAKTLFEKYHTSDQQVEEDVLG